MIERFGFGSVPLINGSVPLFNGSGFRRPKNIRILRIRISFQIRNTDPKSNKRWRGTVSSLIPGVGLQTALQAKVLRPAAHHCLQVLHNCNIKQILASSNFS